MAESGRSTRVRVVHDAYGRSYRVGETDSVLIGRSRAWIMRMAWASMAAIGLFQYGFAAAVPTLTRAYGWSLTDAFWVLGVWVLFQAGVSALAMWLYQRLRRSLAVPMLLGAGLCTVALLTLAHTGRPGPVLLGYSMLGGIGCGLVYATCVAAAVEWFPERTTTIVGLVSSGFGCGALPFVVVAYGLGVDNHTAILSSAGVAVFAIVGVSGLLMRKPPRNWWPSYVDPQLWSVDQRLNRSLPNNVPALEPYSVRAAFRSGTLPMMVVVVVLGAAVALLDIGYLAAFAVSRSPSLVGAAAIGVLAVMTGFGRAGASVLSDRLGRRGTLRLAMAVGGVAQFGLLVAVHGRYSAAVIVFAGLAGAGTGAGYPLLVGMVREWFGEDAKLSNYGLVYTGKAFGGVAGLGLARLTWTTTGATVAFAVAGCLGLFGAALTARMSQPGRRATPLPRLRIDSLRRKDMPPAQQVLIQQAVADAEGYGMRLQ